MANNRKLAMRQNSEAWMAVRERLQCSASQILSEMSDSGLLNHKWITTFKRRFKKQHPNIFIRTSCKSVRLCFDKTWSPFLIIEDLAGIDDFEPTKDSWIEIQ